MELRRALMIGGIAVGLAGGACATSRDLIHGSTAQTWTLNTSPKIPAATGSVSVRPGSDGNQTIDVTVQRLAEPARVFDGASAYVVWLLPPNSPPQNVGTLPLGSDLTGHLQTKTPFRDFQVEVTAEATPAATRPSPNNRVMSATVRLPT